MQHSRVPGPPKSSISVFRARIKGSNACSTVIHARKQAEKRATPSITADDAPPQVLPADLDKLRQLTKGELQRELDVRGLDRQGDKLELANRLLDNLITQESAIQAGNDINGLVDATAETTTTVPGRRGRRTSRRATTAVEPTADEHTAATAVPEVPSVFTETANTTAAYTAAADPAAAAPTARRGRRTSRRVSSVLSEQHEEGSAVEAATAAALQQPHEETSAAAATAESSSTTGDRRSRRTTRKTTAADPAPAEVPAVAASADAAATPVGTAGSGSKRACRTSRVSSVVEPTAAAALAPAAAELHATPARGRRATRKTGTVEAAEPVAPAAAPAELAVTEEAPVPLTRRLRRTSRKSSVMDLVETAPTVAAAATAEDATTAGPARRSSARSSAVTSSTSPVAETTSTAAVDGISKGSGPASNGSSSGGSSRAKLLAQQLAKKAMTTPTVAAATAMAPVTAAAAITPEAVTSAAPVTPAAGDDPDTWAYEQLYAGSQAQSDSLTLGGAGRGAESSGDNWSATYEEILAQVAAENEAGTADEVQLLDSTTFNSMIAASSSASSAAVVAAPSLADIAAAGDAVIPAKQLMPSLVEGPLIAEKAQPDDALSAFDKLALNSPSAAAGTVDSAVAGLLQQQPDLSDISAAVINEGDESLLEEDEAADEALTAFDHMVIDPPVPQLFFQDPSINDIDAAMSVDDLADSSLGEDEEADVALTAFDHSELDTPSKQSMTVWEEQPMMDIAAAITKLPAAGASPINSGEDKEADEHPVLTAFDHIGYATHTASAVDKEPVATTTAAVSVPGVSNSLVGESNNSDADGFAGLLKGWVAAVMKMFEDWQKSLAAK